MSSVDINSLEGWLVKKKNSKKVFGSDVRRWFKIEKVTGEDDEEELAFCYFQSNKTKDSKGWMFLSDITDILEDTNCFTLVSPNRSLTLEAQTRAEHRLWMNGIRSLCPNASYNGIAADKYPHYTKNGIDVKNVDEKRVPKSRESSPRDLDDEASGSYTRPGKSGRSHSHPRSGSHTGEDIADDRGSRSRSRETDMDGPRRGGRSRDGSEDRGHDYDRSRERNDSRDESRDRNGSRDVSRDRDGSRRDREDHRLAARHEVPSTEATASARMHGHINRYDADEKDSSSPRGSASNSRPGSNDGSLDSRSRGHRNGDQDKREGGGVGEDLESLDLSAPAQPSRESRLQDRRDRQRDQEEVEEDDKDGQESKRDNRVPTTAPPTAAVSPSKKVRAAPAGPPPRRAQDVIDSDDDSVEGKRQQSRPLASTEIDDLRAGGALSINLDDDSDEDANIMVDIKAEKRRYRSGGDEMAKSTDSTSRPPRVPVASRSTSNTSGPGGRGFGDGDSSSNFVNEDWDESFEDSPVKPSRSSSSNKKKTEVMTGSRPDSNWLEEDFDD